MAEEKSTAQNKLGELFVDIGVGGLGKFLKGMNSVSATFLLGKNAAEQFTKPIIDLSKNAGKGIVGFEKINSVTGLTISQLQELSLWSKKNNIDFNGFISQVSGLQQNLLNIAMGQGGNIKGFSLLGIDPRSLNYKQPLEALDKIKQRVQQLDEATASLALTELGLDSSLLYAWNHEENRMDKRLLLNEQEIQSLQKQNDAWNNLGVTVEAIFTKWIANQGWISNGLNELTNSTEDWNEALNFLGGALRNIAISFKWLWDFSKPILHGIHDLLVNIGNAAGTISANINTFFNNPLSSKNTGFMSYEEQKRYNASLRGQKTTLDPRTTQQKLKDFATNRISDVKEFSLFTNIPGIIGWYDYNKKKYENAKKIKKNTQIVPMQNNEELISSTPIDNSELPPNMQDSSYTTSLSTPPGGTSNSITNINNFNIRQDISGNDAIDIANRTSDKFEDILDSLQRQNLPSI